MRTRYPFAACVLCLLSAAPVGAADWFVRPSGGSYGLEDGTDYANAFDGGSDVVWGVGGVTAGDTLYICGEHTSLIDVSASGTPGDRITLAGDCSSIAASHVDGTIGRRELLDITATTSGSGEMLRLHNDDHITVQNLTFKDTFGTRHDFNWGGWSVHAQYTFGTHDGVPSSTVLTDVSNGDCTDLDVPYACCAGPDAGTCNKGQTRHNGLNYYLPYADQLPGGVIFNVTDGSKCIITANKDNTITCAAGLSGGKDNQWEEGDVYRLQGDTGAIRISGTSTNIIIRNNTFNYTTTDVGFAVLMSVSNTSAMDHITIDGNTFNGGTNGGDVMIVPLWTWKSTGTCNNMTISNNAFNSVEGAFGMSNSSAIDPDGDGDTDDDSGTVNLDINNNTINIAHGGRWAIKTQSVKALATGYNYIRNNTITTTGTQQRHTNLLQIHWSKDLMIEDNVIEGPTLASGCDGTAIIIDWSFMDDKADHISDGVIIRRNTVYNARSTCSGKGISVYRGRNVDIYSNLVYDCDVGIKVATQHLNNGNCVAAGDPYSCCAGPGTGTCDTAYESSNVRVYNNTVHNSGLGDCAGNTGYHCGDGIFIGAHTPEVIIKNNLISSSVDDGIDSNGGAASVTDGYNWIYGSGSKDCEGFSCGSSTTIGQDPLFVDAAAGKFTLQLNSLAINAGTDMGLPYCESAPEIGYWERCPQPNGESCGGNMECESTNCVDEVCCDSACSAVCMACDVPGSVGSCSPTVAGTDPDDDCNSGEACDGAGACKKSDGQRCDSGGECISGACDDSTCCGTSVQCGSLPLVDGGPDSRGADGSVANGDASLVDGSAPQGGCSCQMDAERSGSAIMLIVWVLLVISVRRRNSRRAPPG